MIPLFSVCVFCGSQKGMGTHYEHIAQRVGHWIGQHQGQLIYGGGKNGLMGVVANATEIAGGRVVGVIPQSLVEKEYARQECDELLIVQSMHERKKLMAEKADSFLVLPGGIGTLEEFFEVWTWRQLGYHNKPIGLLNVANYYDQLLKFLEHSVDQEFLAKPNQSLVLIETEPDVLLGKITQAAVAASHPKPTPF